MQDNTGSAFSRFADALISKGCGPRSRGGGLEARCPAHEDKSPSLSVNPGDKGVVFKCHAGCTNEQVVAALGLEMSDLFDTDMPKQESGYDGDVIDRYQYLSIDGKLLYEVERRPGKRFTQRRPDGQGGYAYHLGKCHEKCQNHAKLTDDVPRVIYRLPQVMAAIREHRKVFVVEGEKDVHTLEGMGFTATCNPGGAGKWRAEYNDLFHDADVVLVPDNDNVGKEHSDVVAMALGAFCRTLRVVFLPGLKDHGDVTDWVVAGGTAEKLSMLVANTSPDERVKPKFWTAPELMAEEFPEQKYAIPGLVAEGVTFLVGPPKVGKSWMSLQLGTSVASGDPALGHIQVSSGKTLYLALEDTPRRLKNRLGTQLGGLGTPPEDFVVVCSWPRANAGGIEQLDRWVQDNPTCKLIIIDTWGKFRSPRGVQDSMYENEYEAVSEIKRLADNYGIGIIAVHHQRKATDNDPLNTVLGSQGLTGAADAIVILTRPRGGEEGQLFITGRDVQEGKAMVSFEKDTCTWQWIGEADEIEANRSESQIIELLKQQNGNTMTPTEVAQVLNMKQGTAKWLLAKMAQEGSIAKAGRGKYLIAPQDGDADPGSTDDEAADNGGIDPDLGEATDLFDALEADFGGLEDLAMEIDLDAELPAPDDDDDLGPAPV